MPVQPFGFSPNEASEILRIATQFKSKIKKIAVFGSRATGRYTATSDIDLVFYGPITPTELRRIATEFEESRIARYVDIVVYDAITNKELKHHIDTVAQLFISFEE